MNLLKTSTLSALETAVKLASGFLVIKFLAVTVGPAGVATFGQFQNFVSAAMLFCSGAFTAGLVRYAAEFVGSDEKSEFYYQNAVGIGTALSLLLALVLLLFAEPISAQVLDEPAYAWVFRVFAVALLPLTWYQIIIAVLNGRGRLLRLIIGKLAASIILLVAAVLLVYSLGMEGGLLSLALAQALAFFAGLYLLLGEEGFRSAWCRPRLSLTGLRDFAPYWLMSMATVVSTPTVLMLSRTYLGESLDWHAAGQWEAALKIAELYLLVITTALLTYYVPKLSAARTGSEERQIIHTVLLFALIASAVLASGVYLLRDWVVLILFSASFAEAAQILPLQLLGSVIKIVAWVIAYHMLIKKRLLLFLGSEILFGASFYLLFVVLVDRFGLIGTAWAYLANYCLYGSFCFIYYLRVIRRASA